MRKQETQMSFTAKPMYKAAATALNQPQSDRLSLLRLDALYTQLNQLGLVTSHFDAEYRYDRRRATSNLLRQLVFIQQLYQGRRTEVELGAEDLQVRAMDLNTHLISTAGFGGYSIAAKINILYQLRKVLEKMLETHFGGAGRRC